MQLTELLLFCAFLSIVFRRVERVDTLCRTGAAQLDPSSPRSPGDEGSATYARCVALLAIFCTGCSHKTPSPPQQAQAPPLQTGKGHAEPAQDDAARRKRATRLWLRLCRRHPRKACRCCRLRRLRRCRAPSQDPSPRIHRQDTAADLRGASERLPQAAASGPRASVLPRPSNKLRLVSGRLAHWPVDHR